MGREYIHRTELKQGVLVMADGGFRCMAENAVFVIHEDEEKRPFVMCQCGEHYLTDDHLDSRGRAIGFFRCSGAN